MTPRLNVVADAHGGDDDAEVEGDLSANHADAIEEIAALGGVHEPHQAVADFQLHRVQVEDLFDFVRFFFCGFVFFVGGGGGEFLLAPRHRHRQQGATGSQHEQRALGQAGEHHQHDEHAGDEQGLGLGENLADDLFAEIILAAGAGDDQARGQGNDESGDLADQAVADGQFGVECEAIEQGPVVLEHADVQAAQDVDEGDDDAGDGVAAHEFAGAIHGAVEIGLLCDVGAAFSRFGFVDDSGVEVGVDGHLFAGHRVQGESSGNFGNSRGAFGDDGKLDDHDDDEDDDADGQGTLGDEIGEGVDDFAGGGHGGVGVAGAVAGGENQPHGGDVQHQAKEGQCQQKGREDGQLERAGNVNGRHHHNDREGDVEAEQDVQNLRRQRNQDHQHEADEGDGEDHAAAIAELDQQRMGGNGGHLKLRGSPTWSRRVGSCGNGAPHLSG